MGQTISRKITIIMGIVLVLFAFLTVRVLAEDSPQAKTVRVGWYDAPGLQNGTDPDSLSGFNYEYLVRIAQYANWQYEFVFGDFSTLEKDLAAGTIDLMGDVAMTDARLKRYDYCAYPSCYSHTLLLCRLDDERFAYNDYATFDGMVVGNSGSSFRREKMDSIAAKQHFHITYKDYPSDGDMLAALNRGDVDTAVISDAIQNKHYKISHEWEPAAQYFVVAKSRPDILDDLNMAMGSLQSSDRAIQAHLFDKYFGGDYNGIAVALTREEREFVGTSAVCTVLLAENQKPLSYVEDGQAKGFIPDYLALISRKTGLKFTYVWCRDYEDMLKRFANGEGDLCGQIYENYGQDNLQGYKIVQPYASLSFGLIYDPGLTQTIHRVAVEYGNMALISRLRERGFTPVEFRSPRDCLDAVKDRRVDAAAMASNVFEQLTYHAEYIHLVYKAQSDLNMGLCLGVAGQDNPYLFRVLSKATGTISPSTITQLMLEDSSLKPEYTLEDYIHRNATFVYIIIVLLVVLLFFILWYQRQVRFNWQMRKATEAKNVFFNNLSHDLRTPLTGILGYSELALKETGAEKNRDYLHKINQSGQLLLALINDTLSLAKIEKDQFHLSQT